MESRNCSTYMVQVYYIHIHCPEFLLLVYLALWLRYDVTNKG
jgi:hypothetical protein